jgi:NADPH-dependent curcumin reductase CurA
VPHLLSGRLTLDETIAVGFDLIADAFVSMLRGGNTGKMLVKRL